MVIENEISKRIIGAAIEVHKQLGPGLLESAYEQCLAHEFTLQKIAYRQQPSIPLTYKGYSIECSYRLDFLVEEKVVVEIKAIDTILPVHQAQVLTYLKLGGWRLGLLINFHTPLLKKGIIRLALGLDEES
jgi:GxxExxY protein